MGFSRQENWRGCHALLQGIFLTQGSNLCLLCLLHRQESFLFYHQEGHLESPQPLHSSQLRLFFLMWTIFKVCIEFVTILFLSYILAFGLEVCGVLAPQPGIEPTYPALECEVLTTGPPGGSSPNNLRTVFSFCC